MKETFGKVFNISYNGLELQFELFNMEYICFELEKQKTVFDSICKVEMSDKKARRCFRDIYMENEVKKYHFFAYIKFFEYEGVKYGLVGGKTNYPNPDISFDYLKEKDNRIARTFLKNEKLKWSTEIIILNHAPFLDKKKDEKQAEFLECFLQRKFNLFDS